MDEENFKESDIDERVLAKRHYLFRKRLDVSGILPHLGRYDLLTKDDREFLSNEQKSHSRKIDYLVEILPRKGRDWFEKLITALKESSEGTGSAHIDLGLALRREKALEKAAASKPQRISSLPGLDGKCQSSTIANDTFWPTRKSILQSPVNTISASISASPAAVQSPPTDTLYQSQKPTAQVSYKNVIGDIQTLEKTHLALKNQIELVHLYESLTKHMQTFRDALIILQSLYEEKFQFTDQSHSKSSQLIKNIIGIDENFDLVQEIDKWNEYLETLESGYTEAKNALFLMDDDRIKEHQLQLKLEGKDSEEFKAWIDGRESFVENGATWFDELRKIIDVKVESDLIHDIGIRMEAGRELNNIWRKWIDFRVSLAI